MKNRLTRSTGLFGALEARRTCLAAGGGIGTYSTITQGDVALTGTLRGVYAIATNGTEEGTGTIRGAEIKARAANAANVGADITTIEAISASADAKTKTVTTLRGMEIMLDGAAGSTVTTAVGLLISNNSSGTQTTSYAIDINSGTASGHKVFTADIRLQNGETIDNATDGLVNVTGKLNATGDFSVATNKLTVAAASGNTVVAGTLGVTGDFAVATSKFTVASASGNTVIAGTLEVTNAATFTASIDIGTFANFSPGSAPGTPAEGDLYYDSTAHKLKVYGATGWETISSAA